MENAYSGPNCPRVAFPRLVGTGKTQSFRFEGPPDGVVRSGGPAVWVLTGPRLPRTSPQTGGRKGAGVSPGLACPFPSPQAPPPLRTVVLSFQTRAWPPSEHTSNPDESLRIRGSVSLLEYAPPVRGGRWTPHRQSVTGKDAGQLAARVPLPHDPASGPLRRNSRLRTTGAAPWGPALPGRHAPSPASSSLSSPGLQRLSSTQVRGRTCLHQLGKRANFSRLSGSTGEEGALGRRC